MVFAGQLKRRAAAASRLAALLLFVPLLAQAQVVLDATSTANVTSTANPITLNWNHTVGVTDNGYMVVGVSLQQNGGAQTVSSVTFGTEADGPNVAATLLGSADQSDARTEIWGVTAPLAGIHQVTVVVANGGGNTTEVRASARTFSNVHQTAAAGTVATATGNSTAPTVNVTGAANDLFVDVVTWEDNETLTAAGGQTSQYSELGADIAAAGSTKSGAASTTMSWTLPGGTSADDWAIVAINLQPSQPQILFDAASTDDTVTDGVTDPTLTWSHSTTVAPNRVMVLGVTIDLNGNSINSITASYASVAMTRIATITHGSSTVRTDLFLLVAPATGSNTVSVAIDSTGSISAVAGVQTFSNVDQIAPVVRTATGSGNSATPTLAMTNTAFEYLVDAIAFNDNETLTQGNLVAATGTQDKRWGNVQTSPDFSGAGSGSNGYTNTTLRWTAAAAADYAIAAVGLRTNRLNLTKTISADVLNVGQNVTYTITAKNNARPATAVLFDAAGGASSVESGSTTFNVTWSHTVTGASNRYLVVGVSIHQNGGTAQASTVTFGSQSLTLIGAQDNGDMRAELWGLSNPTPGTATITVAMSNPNPDPQTGVVGGSQSFYNVADSSPLGTFVGAGATSANTSVSVTNATADFVAHVVAYGDNPGTFTAGQTLAYSAVNNYSADMSGGGSRSTGTANVSMTWTTDQNDPWASAAVPLLAGSSTLSSVTITDVLPTGTTLVSAPGCTGTTTITCNAGNLAAGATATFTITVTSPNATASLDNTATATYNGLGTQTASETKRTVVQEKVCGTPGTDGSPGVLTGIRNDYWPGTATAVAGATSISLGARRTPGFGSGIAIGDLLMVMQMQDAAFDTTNDETYGDGSGSTQAFGTGTGAASALNNAGRWEYVRATSTCAAGAGSCTVNIAGAGAGGGLLYTYTSQAYASTTTQGQRTFQVIRVPQYATATLGSTLTAERWNGATGGVLALDISGTLTLGGATVNVDGLGFRGGAGRRLTGDATAGLTWRDFATSATLTTNGTKGEGVAGTPRYVNNVAGALAFTDTATDTGVEGYVGGSYGRGAPGNAGGGSTDGDPDDNDENSGGGGGGNAGAGGAGGNSWNSNEVSGGQGGGSIGPSLTRVTMGGGGGAGTTNNGSACSAACSGTTEGAGNVLADSASSTGIYSSGAHGGGVIIIRALTVTGTATLRADGNDATQVGRDGGGGGGGGGSILVATRIGTLSGITAQARGGDGGNSWAANAPGGSPGERHGPGGGGGGGYILLSSAAAATDVSGGTNGVTTSALDDYGARPGSPGLVQTSLGGNVLPGADGALCAIADLAVTDTVSSPTGIPYTLDPGGNVTFSQTVINNGPSTADSVVFTQEVPASSTFVSMTPPAGWSCTTPAVGGTGIVTCTRASLSVADGSQAFTFVVQSLSSTPTGYLIANINSVSSATADSNTANNTSSASTPVTGASSADMQVTLTNNATTTTTAGSAVTFTSTARNIAAGTANGATWSMAVPPSMQFTSFTAPAGWTCSTPAVNATSGTISCTANASITGGAAATTFTPVFTVQAGTLAGTVITGTATTGATNDYNVSNNTATSSFTTRGSTGYDMVVTITDAPDPVAPGSDITYTSVVTNNGPSSAPAAGSGVQWTMAVPAGTNFRSMPTPADWSCVAPAVGATSGSITCTYIGPAPGNDPFATGTTSTFTPVFRVNASTATGTTITATPTVNINGTTVNDNVPSSNTASATTLVAAPTSADIAVTKTDTPDPIRGGELINYTIGVTNNGPAIATNVVFTDVIDDSGKVICDTIGNNQNCHGVNASFTTTWGSCTYTNATRTLSCTVTSLSVGQIISVAVVGRSLLSSGTISNTVTKTSADQTDPVASNDTAAVATTVNTPTLIRLRELRATRDGRRVLIAWQTSFESENLGFNVYREVNGERVKINERLVLGTAFRGRVELRAGDSYRLSDMLPDPDAFATYWLEDVDMRGLRTLHGPFSTDRGTIALEASASAVAETVDSATNDIIESQPGVGVIRPGQPEPGPAQLTEQLQAASEQALKIFTRGEGWVRVTYEAMRAAGFDPSQSKKLGVFLNGVEQASILNQSGKSPNAFGPGDSIEFYATPIDVPSSGERTYWLRARNPNGKRVVTVAAGSAPSFAESVPFTYQRIDRSLFVAPFTGTGEGENFFGPVIWSDPTTQELRVANVDSASGSNAVLELVIRGAIEGVDHVIDVGLNGHFAGQARFAGQQEKSFRFELPHAWLTNGAVPLVVTARGGDEDISVLVSARLTYRHLLKADDDLLLAAMPASRSVTVTGFSDATVRVFDVTDPSQPLALPATVAQDGTSFKATFSTPAGLGQRTIIALSNQRVLSPARVSLNQPSGWTSSPSSVSADLLIVAHQSFIAATAPLRAARQAEGISSVVVDVEDVYDEAGFGVPGPHAIRSFVQASRKWKKAPRYLLLVGDATFDPRNYLGLGQTDFVPTKLVATASMKTASDDWFADFDNDGIGDLAVGRIPVRTTTVAEQILSRIATRGTPSGAWAQKAVVVADHDPETFDFAAAAASVAAMIASPVVTSTVSAADANARATLKTKLDDGALLVNYIGHGSIELWGGGLFDSPTAAALANGDRLPVVFAMTCLNGYFHDLYTDTLASALLTASGGGAVGVWASSTLTDPGPQLLINREAMRLLFSNPSLTVGEALRLAKFATSSVDVRKSWIYFGDPSMRLK